MRRLGLVRSHVLRGAFAAALAVLPACGAGGPSGDGERVDAGPAAAPDRDQDGISDRDEGEAGRVDTDQDGVPDFEDDDSDQDGVPDFREAGDEDVLSRPVDSDMDSLPDFRDPDADGNGIVDGTDGTNDSDGDGLADFQDRDDDDDRVADMVEIGADPAAPLDTDSDGTPDYRDVDADADAILDRDELTSDPDGDQQPAYRDTDSDGDCRLDAIEAGDADPSTPPVDSDSDGGGDFIDLDADNDGLKDQLEDPNCNGTLEAGESSAQSADTDLDGVSDLIEVAAGTDAQNPTSNPQASGDFVFLEPYQAPPTPSDDRLAFATAFRNVDVMFNIDISGSMAQEISSIQSSISTVINTLVCDPGEDPVVTGCIPDLQTGVATFGDAANPAITTFGKEISAVNLASQGGNSTQSKLPTSAPGSGNEQALRSIGVDESGIANDGFLRNGCASNASRFGRACFRPNALRLVVEATDEQLNEDDAYAQSPGACGSAACQSIVDFAVANNVQLVGVWSNSSNLAGLRDQWSGLKASNGQNFVPVLQSTAIGTPACNALGAGAFHTFMGATRAIVQGDSNNAANAVTCAIQAVVRYVAQDVSTRAKNDPANVSALGQPVDAPSAFIDHIEVFMDGTASCPNYSGLQDTNGDGKPDTFVGVLPGKKVCWKVFVKMNTQVMPDDQPQMFRATIDVVSKAGALLDSRDVYFLVPPEIPNPPVQ
jgi:hypothetical protein